MFKFVENNPLLLRDWRAFRRGWYRRPFTWIVVATLVIQMFVIFHLGRIPGWPYPPEMIPAYLIACGALFFVSLLFAVRMPGGRKYAPLIQECLQSPLPHRQIFWWMFFRCFNPLAYVLLAILFPLFASVAIESFRHRFHSSGWFDWRWMNSLLAGIILVGPALFATRQALKVVIGIICAFELGLWFFFLLHAEHVRDIMLRIVVILGRDATVATFAVVDIVFLCVVATWSGLRYRWGKALFLMLGSVSVVIAFWAAADKWDDLFSWVYWNSGWLQMFHKTDYLIRSFERFLGNMVGLSFIILHCLEVRLVRELSQDSIPYEPR